MSQLLESVKGWPPPVQYICPSHPADPSSMTPYFVKRLLMPNIDKTFYSLIHYLIINNI